MASFAEDLGGTPTPVNIESPIVNDAASKLVGGIGNAAHLKYAHDTADLEAEEYRSRFGGRGNKTPPLTKEELKAVNYDGLTAALDQKQIDLPEYNARLNSGFRKLIGMFPDRSKTYSDFMNNIGFGTSISTQEESVAAGQQKAIEAYQQTVGQLAMDLSGGQIPDQTRIGNAARLVQHKKALDIELADFQVNQAIGAFSAAEQVQQAARVFPSVAAGSMESILSAANKDGGRIRPENLGAVKAQVVQKLLMNKAQLIASLPPGSDISQIEKLTSEYSSMFSTLVDSLDSSKIEAANATQLAATIDILGKRIFGDLALANAGGGQAQVTNLLNMASNPQWLDQIVNNNPFMQRYIESVGDASNAIANIAMEMSRNTPVTSLSPDFKKIYGQASMNAIGSPNPGNDKATQDLVIKSRELVQAGEVGIAKAWFTPGGISKVRQQGEDGLRNQKLMTSTMQSVEAALVADMSTDSGSLRFSSERGYEYVPGSGFGSQAGAGVTAAFNLGQHPVASKLEILNNYARTYPDLATNGQTSSPLEARQITFEKLQGRIDKLKSGLQGPARETPSPRAPAPSTGVVRRIDDNGNIIEE